MYAIDSFVVVLLLHLLQFIPRRFTWSGAILLHYTTALIAATVAAVAVVYVVVARALVVDRSSCIRFFFALFIHNFGFFQLCTLPFSYLPSHTGFVSNLVVLFVIRSFATSIGHVPMVFLLHHPPQSIFLCRFAVFLHYFSLVFLARSRLGLKCERLFFSLCVYTVLNQNK